MRAPRVLPPSSFYVLLMCAMKFSKTVTDLNEWAKDNAAEISKLEPSELDRFRREFVSWRGLLMSDKETNV